MLGGKKRPTWLEWMVRSSEPWAVEVGPDPKESRAARRAKELKPGELKLQGRRHNQEA